MTTYAPPTSPDVAPREDTARISRVPYLAGLDGMRALAVIAVMVYHANSSWLPGGFLGVEMFFVISGYLITLLIIAERERTYRVSLAEFWKRRARRLLPALYLLMVLVTVYTALFQPAALGQLRGDVIAGLFYVSNWYQLFVGLGYTAAFDFAPLRHLWSLAVEEQFYIVWPLIMIALLGRKGTRKVADVSRWLFVAAVAIAVVTALLYHPGVIAGPEATPDAYWYIGNHPISKIDFAYIGTFSRSSGILLGAAFAMVWRPFAVVRGPLRNKGRFFDAAAVLAVIGLGWMCWNLYLVTPAGVADPRLFRGGLFGASALTLVMLAAVSHSGARANGILGNPVLRWIGLRSYGLYLYHWPVYQAIRELAGNKLTVREFIVATAITVAITEASYRLVETPIRTGSLRTTLRRARISSSAVPRRALMAAGAVAVAATVFAGAALATADLEQSEIADAFAENEDATVRLGQFDVASAGAVDRTPVATSPRTTVVDVEVPVSTVAPPATTRPTPATSPAVQVTTAPPTTAPPTTAPPTTAPPATAPPTTAPPTTAPPVSSLGIVNDMSTITPLVTPPQGPPPQIRLIGFGDSVMLGSAEELSARGFVVDAVQSRQFSAALPEFQAIVDKGLLGSAVVVHLGTNGSFPQSSLDQMMAMLADVPRVVFVTGKADRGWIAGNNEKLRALPGQYANVTVLDWEVLGPQCPGDCFYDDNIHLNGAGQAYYTDLITRVLGV